MTATTGQTLEQLQAELDAAEQALESKEKSVRGSLASVLREEYEEARSELKSRVNEFTNKMHEELQLSQKQHAFQDAEAKEEAAIRESEETARLIAARDKLEETRDAIFASIKTPEPGNIIIHPSYSRSKKCATSVVENLKVCHWQQAELYIYELKCQVRKSTKKGKADQRDKYGDALTLYVDLRTGAITVDRGCSHKEGDEFVSDEKPIQFMTREEFLAQQEEK